jgi:pyruvate/2-oxoglutarate dehydrogenase complex dihydrolipoamide dehydrogenase (E3) component
VRLTLESGDVAGDAMLVATGRQAPLDSLRLDAAGVASTADGVVVNDRLQTTNRRVFAAGDVCSPYKFTHAADAMARIVLQNALFFGRRRASALVIPWCTFTSPELAQVGDTGEQARAQGASTITVGLDAVDRAIVDEATDGFARIHHRKNRIVGATIVAPHAGELIGLVAHVMQHGGTLSSLAGTVFPYPTLSLAFRQAGDAYRRSSLTPRVRQMLQYYFGLLR